MNLPSDPPFSRSGQRGRAIDSWYLAVLSLLLGTVALALMARGYQLGSERATAGDTLTTLADLAPEGLLPGPECSDSETVELGLGLIDFPSLEEATSALGSRLWVAQPSTLPNGLQVSRGAFRARMLGQFRQTTWSLRYDGPAGEEGSGSTLFVASFNAPTFQGPEGQVEKVSVQGRDAALFRPGPTPDQVGVIWREGCRWIYVVGNLQPDQMLAIAEGIRPAT